MFNNKYSLTYRAAQGPVRKMKHVGDVNTIGMTTSPMPSISPNLTDAIQNPIYNNMNANLGNLNNNNYNMSAGLVQQQINTSTPYNNNINNNNNNNNNSGGMTSHINQNYAGYAPQAPQQAGPTQFQGGPMIGNVQMPSHDINNMYGQGNVPPVQFGMFQQPMVQDMALQYGQHLADQGKQIVENQLERWISVSKLKYYFAVDNRYVINKLRLLLFPFTHKDWSLKYDQEKPVQPRYDINAPDLYIPTMAYITYVVVAGLMLGLQKRFSPEQLGIQASSALACSIFELLVYTITLYISNIKTNLKTLDLVAFTGYKFVIIVSALLVSTFFHGMGYYLTLLYCSLSLGFFLLRTLRTKVLQDSAPAATTNAINYDPYGNPQQLDYRGGRKRKLYFLFLIVGGQALFSFILTKHLYFSDVGQLLKTPVETL